MSSGPANYRKAEECLEAADKGVSLTSDERHLLIGAAQAYATQAQTAAIIHVARLDNEHLTNDEAATHVAWSGVLA